MPRRIGGAAWVIDKEQKKTEAVQELETAVGRDPELKGASNDLKRIK